LAAIVGSPCAREGEVDWQLGRGVCTLDKVALAVIRVFFCIRHAINSKLKSRIYDVDDLPSLSAITVLLRQCH